MKLLYELQHEQTLQGLVGVVGCAKDCSHTSCIVKQWFEPRSAVYEQIISKKPGWSNHIARGSGEGHCSQHCCVISTVEAIETSTITVVSIP